MPIVPILPCAKSYSTDFIVLAETLKFSERRNTTFHAARSSLVTTLELSSNYLKILGWVGNRVGHVFAEYAVHADYVHMRDMRMRMKNLIHIIHI